MRHLLQNEQGQDLVEYSLLLAFVMFTLIGIALGFQHSIVGVAGVTNSNLAAASAAVY
jgi:Flp pilus assembly pilin Flp